MKLDLRIELSPSLLGDQYIISGFNTVKTRDLLKIDPYFFATLQLTFLDLCEAEKQLIKIFAIINRGI